ncbi:ras and EF-hand domain-containing-like protein [Labeo rohita]|uniref:Ras and EF-hand domain-containing-like protein n=1 Tax=Labeo rohita TaxID=84645 RepID=A0A498MF76_LABRO|nr:ras and EF-hand domain-containing-like protein [Labeo rohita]
MSETGHVGSTRVVSSGSDQNEKQKKSRKSVNKEAGLGHVVMLDKIENFFQICDSEGKGFITRTDMRKLHKELPLTTEELENVFDSLDPDKNGYLTLGEFSSGFSKFIISLQKEGLENETFPSPSEVRSLWAQLRNDEPHLLSDFEEFLAHEARQERKEMESALGRIDFYVNSFFQDSENLQSRSQELQQRLRCKEQELKQLFKKKRRRLEHQSRDLHSEHQVSRLENVKLKISNEELSRELEHTCQELVLAQEHSSILQEQASRLQQEREMSVYAFIMYTQRSESQKACREKNKA